MVGVDHRAVRRVPVDIVNERADSVGREPVGFREFFFQPVPGVNQGQERLTYFFACAAMEAHKRGFDSSRIEGFAGQEFSYHTDQQRAIPCPPIEME